MQKLLQLLRAAAALLHVSSSRNAEKPTVQITAVGWTF